MIGVVRHGPDIDGIDLVFFVLGVSLYWLYRTLRRRLRDRAAEKAMAGYSDNFKRWCEAARRGDTKAMAALNVAGKKYIETMERLLHS